MSLLEKIVSFFHRVEELSDRTWNEINAAITRGELCKFCEQILSFPMAILPCGHLYDSNCLNMNWTKHVCPECNKSFAHLDVVQSDQQVAEVGWNPTSVVDKKSDHDLASLEALLASSPVQSNRDPLQVSEREQSPVMIREPSPKIASPRVKTIDKRKINETQREIGSVRQMSDTDRQIWKYVQNFWLIPNSDQLLERGYFYNTTVLYLTNYIPKELSDTFNKFEVDNLVDLIKQNSEIGSYLMYAMMLFLGLEYYTRDSNHDLDVKLKFRQLFNYELFQKWKSNLPDLKSENLKSLWQHSKIY
mgnify:CR=1 FL=1